MFAGETELQVTSAPNTRILQRYFFMVPASFAAVAYFAKKSKFFNLWLAFRHIMAILNLEMKFVAAQFKTNCFVVPFLKNRPENL